MDEKSTSPWIAAAACCALVLLAGIVGIAVLRMQLIGRIDSHAEKIRASVTQLENRLSSLEIQLNAVAQSAKPDMTPVDALKNNLGATDAQVSELKTRIETLEKKPAPVTPVIAPSSSSASVSTAAATANPAPLVPQSSPSYLALKSAVESGLPFTAELSAWKIEHGTAPDATAALEPLASTGAPTDDQLRIQLRKMLDTPADKPADEHNVIERINMHLTGLVSIKKQSLEDGYSSIRQHVNTSDINNLVHEAEALPEALRPRLVPWVTAVRQRNAALEALTHLNSVPANSARSE